MKSPFSEMRGLWEQQVWRKVGGRGEQTSVEMEVPSRLWGGRSGAQSDIHLRVISVWMSLGVTILKFTAGLLHSSRRHHSDDSCVNSGPWNYAGRWPCPDRACPSLPWASEEFRHRWVDEETGVRPGFAGYLSSQHQRVGAKRSLEEAVGTDERTGSGDTNCT